MTEADRQTPIPQTLSLIGILLITAFLYWPGLDGGLILDDYNNIGPVMKLEQGSLTWKDAILTNASGLLGRPISMISFVFDQLTFGEIRGFKFTNLMLHLIASCLVFWLAYLLFAAKKINAWWPSALVCILWATAPLYVSTVLYIVQRMTILSTVFIFCGLISYIKGRVLLEKNNALAWLLILSSYFVWLPLAILSKESGALLPLLITTTELFMFGLASRTRSIQSLRYLHLITTGLPILLAIIYLSLNPGFILDGYQQRPFSLGERLLTETRVLANYLGSLLIPNGAWLGLYHDDFAKSHNLLTPISTLFATIAILSAMAAPAIFRKEGLKPVWFGLFFFLVSHSMESTIIPLELYFEHRNYLAGFGVFFLLSYACVSAVKHTHNIKLYASLLIIGLLLLLAATYQRTHTWSSFANIVLTAYESHPNSLRVNSDLAELYSVAGNINLALHHLDRIDDINDKPMSGAAIQRLFVSCINNQAPSETLYQQAESIPTSDVDPYTSSVTRSLIEEYEKGNCDTLDTKRTADILNRWLSHEKMVRNSINAWILHISAGRLYAASGYLGEAIEHFDSATHIFPKYMEPTFYKIRTLILAGVTEQAQLEIDELKRIPNKELEYYDSAISELERLLRSKMSHQDAD